VFGHRRWRLQRHGRPRGQRRKDPTRRRQRDGCCRTRCGLHRPVGYNVFPGQLADLWAVEIGQRLVFGYRQSSAQIQTEVLRCEDVLSFGGRVVGARRNPTRLSRQLLFRHLPCIGTSRALLEHSECHSSLGASAARRWSSPTTDASAKVVVSPRFRPSATSRNNRRMILPLRVFGRSGVR